MKKLTFAIIAMLFIFASCSKTDIANGAVKITAEEAKKMMDEQEVVIVDVRREDEYIEKHIPGAILIPNEDISDKAPDELPDKKATILVYCRSGRRSAEAAEKLFAIGYENIYDFGGIIDWPYEVAEESYEK